MGRTPRTLRQSFLVTVLCALALATVLLAAVSFQEGKPIPKLSLKTLEGQTITSESLRGKVVLLDFWATWCPPCLKAIPELKSLAKDMAGEPFVLISLSGDRSSRPVQKFVTQNGIEWPQYWDEKGRVMDPLGINTLPTYLLLDHTGYVVYYQEGWSNTTDSVIRTKIQEALRLAKLAQSARPVAP